MINVFYFIYEIISKLYAIYINTALPESYNRRSGDVINRRKDGEI